MQKLSRIEGCGFLNRLIQTKTPMEEWPRVMDACAKLLDMKCGGSQEAPSGQAKAEKEIVKVEGLNVIDVEVTDTYVVTEVQGFKAKWVKAFQAEPKAVARSLVQGNKISGEIAIVPQANGKTYYNWLSISVDPGASATASPPKSQGEVVTEDDIPF